MEKPEGCPSQLLWERFEAKFVIEEKVDGMDACWIWIGARKQAKRDYGFFDKGLAHRRAYEWFEGPIPSNKEIHHVCNQPPCVNPEHLDAVYRHQNLEWSDSLSTKNGQKTHCPQGHQYSGINSFGRRICSICQAAANKRARERKRALKS